MVKPKKIAASCYYKLHELEVAAACTVHGVYFERSGTLLLDAVVYNGSWIDTQHLATEDREYFMAALTQHVADELFYED